MGFLLKYRDEEVALGRKGKRFRLSFNTALRLTTSQHVVKGPIEVKRIEVVHVYLH